MRGGEGGGLEGEEGPLRRRRATSSRLGHAVARMVGVSKEMDKYHES